MTPAIEHVRELSVGIGPRPTCGEGERRAADYVFARMKDFGAAPTIETFRCPKSGWRPFAIASGMSVAAFALASVGGVLPFFAAFALNGAAFVCAVRQLRFLPNPIARLVPHGESRNVVARSPASGAAKRRLVLSSHLDTHRTPLAFSSPGWLALYRALAPIGMVAFIVMELALGYAAFAQWVAFAGWAEIDMNWRPSVEAIMLRILIPTTDGLVYPVALALATLCGAIQGFILFLTLQADLTPYTAGANDNASGVGALLELGERLSRSPLAHTEVLLVATGAEETGLYGAQDFFRRRASSIRDGVEAVFMVNLDNIGGEGAGPVYLSRETMLATYRSDPYLLKLAGEVAAERPELGARSATYRGAYTDGAVGIMNGIPTITFLGLRPDGSIPNVHQAADVFENVDRGTLERTTDFVEALIRRMDSRNA